MSAASPSLKLWFAPFTRASRPRWLLEELGVPYELVVLNMKEAEHKRPSYKGAIHPHGAVPALSIDGQSMIESGAMLATLADLFAERGLAPKSGSRERARYYEWLFYSYATLEPAVHEISMANNPATGLNEEAKQRAQARWEEIISYVDMRLGEGPWAVGDSFTAADCAVGAILIWAGSMKLLEGRTHAHAYAERCKARPAYQRARKA
jgi:glutathione S-transferase